MAKRSLAYCSTCGAIRWRNGRGLAMCPDHGKLVTAWTADDLEDAEPVGRVSLLETVEVRFPRHPDEPRSVEVRMPRRLRVYRVEGRDGLFLGAGDWHDFEGRVPPAGDVLAAVHYESAATGWTSVRIRLLRPLVASDAEIVKFDK